MQYIQRCGGSGLGLRLVITPLETEGHIKIKALKCKMLGAELVHTHCTVFISAFYADDYLHVPTVNVRR